LKHIDTSSYFWLNDKRGKHKKLIKMKLSLLFAAVNSQRFERPPPSNAAAITGPTSSKVTEKDFVLVPEGYTGGFEVRNILSFPKRHILGLQRYRNARRKR